LRRGENRSTRRKTSRSREENPGPGIEPGVRRALSPLCYPCSPYITIKISRLKPEKFQEYFKNNPEAEVLKKCLEKS